MFVTFTMKSTLNAIASSPGVIHHTTLLNRRPPHIRGAELHTLQRGASTPPYPSQSFEPTHTHFCGKTHTHPEQDKNSTRLSWEGLIYPLPFSGGWNLPLLPSLPKPVNNTTPHYFQPVQGKNTHIQHKKASPRTSLISYSYPGYRLPYWRHNACHPTSHRGKADPRLHPYTPCIQCLHACEPILIAANQPIHTDKQGRQSIHACEDFLTARETHAMHPSRQRIQARIACFLPSDSRQESQPPML